MESWWWITTICEPSKSRGLVETATRPGLVNVLTFCHGKSQCLMGEIHYFHGHFPWQNVNVHQRLLRICFRIQLHRRPLWNERNEVVAAVVSISQRHHSMWHPLSKVVHHPGKMSKNIRLLEVTLWWTYKKPWKITMSNGKIHYKWSFSIAMLVHQRVKQKNNPAPRGSEKSYIFNRNPTSPHLESAKWVLVSGG